MDFNTINNLITSINSNKKILRKYKYNLSKINTAMQYYALFLKENNYYNDDVEIQNSPKIETQNNKQVEVEAEKQFELQDNISGNTISIADEIKANRKAFITWLNSHNITGALVFKYLSAIKECEKAANNLTLKDKDLYLITDIQNLTKIRDFLSYNNEFQSLNRSQNNLLLTVFDKLIEFRKGNVMI